MKPYSVLLATGRKHCRVLWTKRSSGVHFASFKGKSFFSTVAEEEVSILSDDPRIAEVEVSTILARSAGAATVIATFSLSKTSYTQKCQLQVIVYRLPVSLRLEKTRKKGAISKSVTVPLRALLPFESVPLPAARCSGHMDLLLFIESRR